MLEGGIGFLVLALTPDNHQIRFQSQNLFQTGVYKSTNPGFFPSRRRVISKIGNPDNALIKPQRKKNLSQLQSEFARLKELCEEDA